MSGPGHLAGEGAGLLSEATVAEYLTARGVIPAGTAVEATALGGGVSNIVLRVTTPTRSLVVKQALPRLRVKERWLARPQRALAEAAALRYAGRLTPGSVPRVLDSDADACALVLTAAPPAWQDWKTGLLAGRIDATVATHVGRLLAIWHSATYDDKASHDLFADTRPFVELRLDPYYRFCAQLLPTVARPLRALADELLERRLCLVHGDFSPKNVLVGRGRVWVIDFEVAHYGDPAFDLAFMTSHLLLKALRRPRDAPRLEACWATFFDCYRDAVTAALAPDQQHLARHLGALLLARVHGKSPVEYLDPGQQQAAASLGTDLVLDPPDRLAEAWSRTEKVP